MRAHLALLFPAAITAPLPPPAEVTIVATDYAFAAPPTIRAGFVSFRLLNKGATTHELTIAMLRPAVTVAQLRAAVKEGKPTESFVENAVGLVFAGPGKTSTASLSTTVVSGRTYVIYCDTRDADGRTHDQLGMLATMTATDGSSTRTAERVDTVVGNEYAYTRYPRTLGPGRHVFAFMNEGKVDHEAILIALKPGVTYKQITDLDKAGGDTRSLMEEIVGILWSGGGTISNGLLALQLIAGREYLLVCTYPANQKPLTHRHLGMVGAIRVTDR
jgi:hypothetical protein